jgi:hypothetical protein
MHLLSLLGLMAASASAIVLPREDPAVLFERDTITIIKTISTGETTVFLAPLAAETVASTILTTTTLGSVICDYPYCSDGTKYCMYWAGVTGYDPGHGPVPGETRTALGVCDTTTTYHSLTTATISITSTVVVTI